MRSPYAVARWLFTSARPLTPYGITFVLALALPFFSIHSRAAGILISGRSGSSDGTIWAFNTDTGEDRFLTIGARPRVSPDGKKIVFLRDRDPFANRGNVYTRDLESG